MSWEVKSLDNIITFQRGFDLPKTDFKVGDFPVVGSTGIIGFHNEFKVKSPCVVTGRSGTLGVFQYLNEDFWAHNTTLWVKEFQGNHPKFIYYLLQTLDFKSLNGGVAVPTLNRNVLKNVFISYPKSLETQKRIASILSAYDDLIENNLKRIKLLEETAQNIYKEWFVNFRFPNYEHTAFDAESGLPVGWEMKKMVELMNISGGGTPSTKIPNYWDGEVIWFSPTDLGKNSSLILLDSSKKITLEGLTKSSAKLLPPMTILMSSRATIGLFGMINKECSTNQGFINIIPIEIFYRYYILQNLIGRKNEIIGKATGTTFKEISKGVFNTMTIMKPKSNVVKLYFNFADSIFKQVEIIEIQNQKLKEARDILLPRLMNRTIEV
jgi:type I restriction enzyme S subunit